MLGLRARTLRGGIEDIRTDHVLGPPGDGAPLVDQAAAVPPVGENQCRACPGGNTAGLEVSLLRPWGVESREPALKIIVEIHEEREPRALVLEGVVHVFSLPPLPPAEGARGPCPVHMWPVERPRVIPVQPEAGVEATQRNLGAGLGTV